MRHLLLIPARLAHSLLRDELLLILLLSAVALVLVTPASVSDLPALVDGHTLAALAGLLLLTTGLEESGALQRAGAALVARVHSERQLALTLVALSALLASVLTNDIALFIVVPLTLGLRSLARLPVARLVIFEALAVNAGSVATPMGNPQNLFLWQRSGVSFAQFVGEMAPLAALLLGLLLWLTVAAFPATRIASHGAVATPALRRPLLWTCLGLYPVFLALVDLGAASWGLAALAAVFLAAFRGVVREADWGLILVFALMFIDLRLLAALPAVQATLQGLGLAAGDTLLLTGVAVSQLISNVPAAILLAEHTDDWNTLAWAVSLGGFGSVLGSLANLIALRLLGEPGAWLRFHLWSVPFLAAALLLVLAWRAL